MVYKRYSSPFEENPQNTHKPPPPPLENKPKPDRPKPQNPPDKKPTNPVSLGFLDSLSSDDIMIIALLIILLSEDKGKRDVPMILTLGFLFLIQYIDAD